MFKLMSQLCHALGSILPDLEAICNSLIEAQLPAIIDGLVEENLNPQQVEINKYFFSWQHICPGLRLYWSLSLNFIQILLQNLMAKLTHGSNFTLLKIKEINNVIIFLGWNWLIVWRYDQKRLCWSRKREGRWDGLGSCSPFSWSFLILGGHT